MKFITSLSLLLLVAVSASAQKDTVGLNVPVKEGKVIYEQIVEVPGKKSADLYKNARQWFVNYFKNSKEVIQSEDKEAGQIMAKGTFVILVKSMSMGHPYFDKATIQVDCKDDKYRVKLYDFNIIQDTNIGHPENYATTPELLISKLVSDGKSPYSKGQCRQMLENGQTEALAAMQSLKKAMTAKSDDF